MFVYRLDKDDADSEKSLNISKGFCVRIPKGVVHTIYSVDELTNKTVIVLINLEPRKIFGIESQGMLLASIDGDEVSLLQTDKEMIPGSEIG